MVDEGKNDIPKDSERHTQKERVKSKPCDEWKKQNRSDENEWNFICCESTLFEFE